MFKLSSRQTHKGSCEARAALNAGVGQGQQKQGLDCEAGPLDLCGDHDELYDLPNLANVFVNFVERLPGLRVFALLAIVAIAVRWKTFGNPVLEFDEQFYLLVGDRMLHGALPFVDIFDRKPIGLFLIYAGVRLLGGEGVIQYQIVALIFVIFTAALLHRFAMRITSRFGALAAALGYILWLNITEGEGGQTPVFYNLLMIGAAMITATIATERSNRPILAGSAAMLLVGLSLQIKYTVAIEGIFFGLTMLWAARCRGESRIALTGMAALYVVIALLPTIAVATTYAWLGHWQAFAFANFQSQFGRLPVPLPIRMLGLLAMIGILLPLLASVRRVEADRDTATGRFVIGWLLSALASLLIFGSFMSTHYDLPVLLPAILAASPFFGRTGTGRKVALTVLVLVAIAGQAALAVNEWAKGGRREATIVARAAKPVRGCIYVYDGYPSLYQMTGSCLPTRYAFPGHLNTIDEGSASSLGADPATELNRILSNKPEVIVDDWPIFQLYNPVTRTIINRALKRDYHLVLKLRTGSDRFRLVYRRNDTGSISTGRM
jgi:hypothetical protein